MIKYLIVLFVSFVDMLLFNYILLDYIIFLTATFTLLDFIRNVSKKINFLDIISVIACVLYLLAPWFAYEYLNRNNPTARIWGNYMTIEKPDYFSFAFPATIFLILGLNIYNRRDQIYRDHLIIKRCKIYLKNKSYIGFILIGIGILSLFVYSYIPSSFKSIFYYFNQLTFIGLFYLLFSGIPFRPVLLIIGLGLLVTQSMATGMFSELLVWSVFGGILLSLGKRRFNYLIKFTLVAIGVFIIFLIQSIKHEYRKDILTGADKGSDPAYFYSLVKDRVSDPASIIEPERTFGMLARANQGLFVGKVMQYVPRNEKYAYGETILVAIGASLVPRFFWKSKPEAGGRENVCRFLGDCRRKKYSYNIGQLGEAYVNFGRIGGICFMFIYGFFISFSFNKISNISKKYPTIILWVPMFYFMALSLETDVLTFLNAFTKAVVFALFCFIGFKWVLKIRL